MNTSKITIPIQKRIVGNILSFNVEIKYPQQARLESITNKIKKNPVRLPSIPKLRAKRLNGNKETNKIKRWIRKAVNLPNTMLRTEKSLPIAKSLIVFSLSASELPIVTTTVKTKKMKNSEIAMIVKSFGIKLLITRCGPGAVNIKTKKSINKDIPQNFIKSGLFILDSRSL